MESMTTSEINRNEAYFSHKGKQKQCDKIKALLISHEKGLTIGEISTILDLPKSTISGRIGDLKPDVIEVGTRIDLSTNKSVTVWRWSGGQGLLFDLKAKTPAIKLKEIEQICKENRCEISERILKIIGQK